MRGGKREGAGRKPGSQTKKTSAIAKAATEAGITPVEVMLRIMRAAYAAGDAGMALEAAKSAAAYCHPRLSAIQVDLAGLTEEQLRSEMRGTL